MRLFEEIPYLNNGHIHLRELSEQDADDVRLITENPGVYRYLPAFLFERKYPDQREMIRRIKTECFDTKESILLGICEEDDRVIGIAEIYNYEEEKCKASIGYRLNEDFWGRGIATETAGMLRDYLVRKTDVRKVTAHVMAENRSSGKVLEKNGFVCEWPDLQEDWGHGYPVCVDKYIYRFREAADEV
ncbi:MAG: GNAT family N-acetyltransferase [Solobacterium sp.]|nr:GNAT family N-acetyltransferase [Solobacterium sp.]